MRRNIRFGSLCHLFTAAALALPAAALAQQRQDPAAIQVAVENFVRAQTSGLPGAVAITVGPVDPRFVLPHCPALEVFLPAGARLWGTASIGVRCGGQTAWSLYVAAQVRVTGTYVVTARPVPQGKPLDAADVTTQSGDLTRLPNTILTDAQHALGRMPTANLLPGEPLRQDMLRLPLAIQQGQTVKLQSAGNGFRVSVDGTALNNAQDGQLAQVRAPSGQTVSGTARAGGIVEVRF